MTLDHITLDDALQLLSMPREVGTDAEGNVVTAQNGRYGPYLKKGSETRSLENEEQIFTVTPEEAEVLFAQPKRRGRQAKAPIAALGARPDTGAEVRILEGRYGPYATDGTVNASLPRGTSPTEITLEDAVALLRAREEAGPSQRPAKKKAPAKKTAKKATKKGTKSTRSPSADGAAKKAAAKKPAKKVVKKAVKRAATGDAPS
jgi:DNA topoisomerase-1